MHIQARFKEPEFSADTSIRQSFDENHPEDAPVATTKNPDPDAGPKDKPSTYKSVCAHFEGDRIPFEFGTLIYCPANTRVKFDPGIIVWYFIS